MPPTNSTNFSPDPHHDLDAVTHALGALQETLDVAMTQMDSMSAALQDVIALFKAGALSGAQGDHWLAQVRDKVLPFVADTQAVLCDVADDLAPEGADTSADPSP
jgi:exonuclease VII small subunit